MKEPRVSICLPTYNGAKYLSEAIESVLNQTIDDLELVIGDDASTDGTQEILESFAKRDPRVKVSYNDKNLGYVRNQVSTFRRCRGKYIKTYAQDDSLVPTCCEIMLEAFTKHDNVSLVTASVRRIDENGKKIDVVHKMDKAGLYKGAEIIKRYLRDFTNITGNTSQIMFRMEHAGNGFNPAYNHGEDVEFGLRLLEQGDYFYIAEPLIDYRIHQETTTIGTLADMSFASDHVRLVDRFGSYLLADGVSKDELWSFAIEGLIKKMGHALYTRGITYNDFTAPPNWDKPKPGDDFENDEPEAFRRLACHLLKYITEKHFSSSRIEQRDKLIHAQASLANNGT